jgi:hypothetical protein
MSGRCSNMGAKDSGGETPPRPVAAYHVGVLQGDGSIVIAWQADGFASIAVRARFRPREELEALARGVADVALLERSLHDLRVALTRDFPGDFDLLTREPAGRPGEVVVSFHPPRGEPNPDPE